MSHAIVTQQQHGAPSSADTRARDELDLPAPNGRRPAMRISLVRQRRAYDLWHEGRPVSEITKRIGWKDRSSTNAPSNARSKPLPVPTPSCLRSGSAWTSNWKRWFRLTGRAVGTDGHEPDAKSAARVPKALSQQAALWGLNKQSVEAPRDRSGVLGAIMDYAVHQVMEHDSDPHDVARGLFGTTDPDFTATYARKLGEYVTMSRQADAINAADEVVDAGVVEDQHEVSDHEH